MSSTTKRRQKQQPDRGPGRPQGAKTAERAVMTKQVTPCPNCGSTKEPVGKRLIREGRADGTHEGRPYDYYRHWFANCADCNRAVLLREYDYLPELPATD